MDVTIRRPANRYLSLTVLHLVFAVFKFLTRARYPKILQSQDIIRLSQFLCIWRLHLNEDVDVAHVDEHVRLEHSLSRIHLLENAEADLEIANEVLLGHYLVENLEMASIVLLTLRLIAERDHEVVYYNLLFTSGIVHHRLTIIRFVIKNVCS